MSQTKYLVTGANGYIAMHVVDQLLKQGHYVRGTIRSLNDTEKVESLKKLGPIEIVEANLMDDESIRKAVHGIDVIMHVASPIPTGVDDDELYIKPAVQGTLSVLKAAVAENVKKVIITSSTATNLPAEMEDRAYTENEWVNAETIPKGIYSGYEKSKIIAEKAAWAFYEEQKAKTGKCFHMATVLPSLTIGPVLSAANRSSASLFIYLCNKTIPKMDDVVYHVCDVRDVAAAHLKAAELDEANGHRFVCVSSPKSVPLSEIAKILAENGYEVSNVEAKPPRQGTVDNANFKNILKIPVTDVKKSVLDTAESLLNFGLIKK